MNLVPQIQESARNAGVMLETQHKLTPRQSMFVDIVLGESLPLSFQRSTDTQHAYMHVLMARHDYNQQLAGPVLSPYYAEAIDLFKDFCNVNNIECKTVLRAAFNSTGCSGDRWGGIHVDHLFPHKVFLMYLNKFDQGDTYIFNDSDEPIYTIKAGMNRCVVWDGRRHAQGFCAIGQRRMVFVVTFI